MFILCRPLQTPTFCVPSYCRIYSWLPYKSTPWLSEQKSVQNLSTYAWVYTVVRRSRFETVVGSTTLKTKTDCITKISLAVSYCDVQLRWHVSVCSVPPRIYSFPGVTEQENQPTKLICLSDGDPSPDLTFHRTGHTDVYHLGTNVWHHFNSSSSISVIRFVQFSSVLIVRSFNGLLGLKHNYTDFNPNS